MLKPLHSFYFPLATELRKQRGNLVSQTRGGSPFLLNVLNFPPMFLLQGSLPGSWGAPG